MTDKQRDPAADGPEGADRGAAADADAQDELDETQPFDDGTEDDLTDAELDAIEAEEELAAAGAAGPAGTAARAGSGRATGPAADAGAAGRRRGRLLSRPPTAAPSVAEEAVHIQDRASAWFVIASIGVFVAILLYALLFGRNGVLSDLFPTPRPVATPIVTIAPSGSASTAPSGGAAQSPSGGASASPSSGASTQPSGSAGASPSVAPSVAPSVSPSAAPESAAPSAS